jgi:hypothetical protein
MVRVCGLGGLYSCGPLWIFSCMPVSGLRKECMYPGSFLAPCILSLLNIMGHSSPALFEKKNNDIAEFRRNIAYCCFYHNMLVKSAGSIILKKYFYAHPISMTL